jgi:hypothetical protein
MLHELYFPAVERNSPVSQLSLAEVVLSPDNGCFASSPAGQQAKVFVALLPRSCCFVLWPAGHSAPAPLAQDACPRVSRSLERLFSALARVREFHLICIFGQNKSFNFINH